MTVDRKEGFTLLELLVVIAIISLLSSIVLASLTSARMKSRSTKRLQDLTTLRTVVELYHTDYNQYPKTFQPGDSILFIYDCYGPGFDIPDGYVQDRFVPRNVYPTYISVLPHDPLNGIPCKSTGTGGYYYAYASDGKDYKIMVVVANSIMENCLYGRVLGLEDPIRDCTVPTSEDAWSVYTPDARLW